MSLSVQRLVAQGLRSIVFAPPIGTGGTVSARYCYSVYLRHRIIAARHGLTTTPASVVELGPGDSLGIGLMALLTGSERYVAVDAVRHASLANNLTILDQLVQMLDQRNSLPFDGDCEAIRPQLESYEFPGQLIDANVLATSLNPERVERIREALRHENTSGRIRYLAPFGEMSELPDESVDWVFSQAVMEHVDDPAATYKQCHRCLKAGGLMTHQIDFRCHETAPEWNGHWKYPGWLWALMRGRRPWFVNRLPYTAQHSMQVAAGFDVISEIRREESGGIRRDQLARKYRALSDIDLRTAGALLVSVKRAQA